MVTSYAIKVGTNYIDAIYADYFTTTSSFDNSIQCQTATEVNNLLDIVSRMTSDSCVAVQRDVKYIDLTN